MNILMMMFGVGLKRKQHNAEISQPPGTHYGLTSAGLLVVGLIFLLGFRDKNEKVSKI